MFLSSESRAGLESRSAAKVYVTTKSKGTGLGLAVVKKIADEHGARVRIANLSAPSATDPGAVLARGAQVSLSFSKFAPAAAVKAAAAAAASEAH